MKRKAIAAPVAAADEPEGGFDDRTAEAFQFDSALFDGDPGSDEGTEGSGDIPTALVDVPNLEEEIGEGVSFEEETGRNAPLEEETGRNAPLLPDPDLDFALDAPDTDHEEAQPPAGDDDLEEVEAELAEPEREPEPQEETLLLDAASAGPPLEETRAMIADLQLDEPPRPRLEPTASVPVMRAPRIEVPPPVVSRVLSALDAGAAGGPLITPKKLAAICAVLLFVGIGIGIALWKVGRSPAPAGAAEARARADTTKTDTANAKSDTTKSDTAKSDTAKSDTAKTDTAKTDTAKTEPAETETANANTAKPKSDARSPNTANVWPPPDSAAAAREEGGRTPGSAREGASGTPDSAREGAGRTPAAAAAAREGAAPAATPVAPQQPQRTASTDERARRPKPAARAKPRPKRKSKTILIREDDL